MNIFITLFAIRKDSWTALVWKRQSLMCLYMQLSVFCIQQASIDFKLNTYFAWLIMSVNFVQFIRFVNVFWPLAKCHEEAEYHWTTVRES